MARVISIHEYDLKPGADRGHRLPPHRHGGEAARWAASSYPNCYRSSASRPVDAFTGGLTGT
jgi:hypothetical protein